MITAKESDIERRKQEMLDSLPPYYQESPEANAIMRGNASEIERKRAEAQDLLDQMFVSTATWGLDYWDRVLDLSLAPRMLLNSRRNRILAKLNGASTASVANLANIINAHLTKRSAKIVEMNHEYRFEVEIEANESVGFLDIAKDLNEVKPAHLDYAFRQNVRCSMYFATALLAGEEVSVYPWSPTSIELRGQATLGAYSYEYDTTSIYPKEGD